MVDHEVNFCLSISIRRELFLAIAYMESKLHKDIRRDEVRIAYVILKQGKWHLKLNRVGLAPRLIPMVKGREE